MWRFLNIVPENPFPWNNMCKNKVLPLRSCLHLKGCSPTWGPGAQRRSVTNRISGVRRMVYGRKHWAKGVRDPQYKLRLQSTKCLSFSFTFIISNIPPKASWSRATRQTHRKCSLSFVTTKHVHVLFGIKSPCKMWWISMALDPNLNLQILVTGEGHGRKYGANHKKGGGTGECGHPGRWGMDGTDSTQLTSTLLSGCP